MGSIRHGSAAAILAIVVLAGGRCGSTNGSAADATPSTARPALTTTSTSAPAFRLQSAGLSVAFIPAGFTAVHTTLGRAIPGHVTGPAPGWVLDGQQFWNATT